MSAIESIYHICRGAGAHLCRRIDLATAAEDRHSLAGLMGIECERVQVRVLRPLGAQGGGGQGSRQQRGRDGRRGKGVPSHLYEE